MLTAHGFRLARLFCICDMSQTHVHACAQVVSFAESLQDGQGKALVRCARIASSLPLPQDMPDLVVATPAGLMNATTDLGPYSGWEWTKSGIVSRCGVLQASQTL